MWEGLKKGLFGGNPASAQMPIEVAEKHTLLTRSAECYSIDATFMN